MTYRWRDISVLLRGASRPTILDVGANRGQSVRRFARICPHTEILSFEPGPEAFMALEADVKRLKPDVHAVNAAVRARRSQKLLFENSMSEMSSLLAPTSAAWGEATTTTSVDILTLYDY